MGRRRRRVTKGTLESRITQRRRVHDSINDSNTTRWKLQERNREKNGIAN